MLVYTTRLEPRLVPVVHRDQDCSRLKVARTTETHDLAEFGDRVRVCRLCFEDAPRVDVLHKYCHRCQSMHPCAHNGGVLVYKTKTRRKPTMVSNPGETHVQPRYVWPEHVGLYGLDR